MYVHCTSTYIITFTLPNLKLKVHKLFLLFQAQRDYFGAHTYELLSDPGKFVHTNWTGLGGTVSATTYDA